MEQCGGEWGTGCRGLSWHEPAYVPDSGLATQWPSAHTREGHSHRSTGVTPSPPGPGVQRSRGGHGGPEAREGFLEELALELNLQRRPGLDSVARRRGHSG